MSIASTNARVHSVAARSVAVLIGALALLVAPLSDDASAGIELETTCLIAAVLELDGTEFGTPTTTLIRGRSYRVVTAVGPRELCADLPGTFEVLEVLDFEPFGVLHRLTRAGVPTAWSTFGDLTEVLDVNDDPLELLRPDETPDVVGVLLAATPLGGALSTGFDFTLPNGAALGAYRIAFEFLDVPDEDGVVLLLDLLVADARAPRSSGPAATVTCDTSAPVVGATVTCTVTSGAPDFDIVWTASTNPVLASGVVRTDASGNGRFSFVVPVAARGQELFVELVDWTRPTSIGVVGGPVPGAVPAGDGSSQPGSLAAVLAALAVSVLAVSTRRRLQRAPRLT
jgi:hypothetical protein